MPGVQGGRERTGIRSSGTGVTDSCALSCGCWELNLGPVEEQPVLGTPVPSLQPTKLFLLNKKAKAQIGPNG